MGDTSSNLNEAGFYPAQQQPLPAAVCGSVPKRAQKHPVGIADIIIDDCSALCQPKFCPKRGIFCLSQHLVGGFSRIHHQRPGKGVRGKGVALALRNVLPTVCRARRPSAPRPHKLRITRHGINAMARSLRCSSSPQQSLRLCRGPHIRRCQPPFTRGPWRGRPKAAPTACIVRNTRKGRPLTKAGVFPHTFINKNTRENLAIRAKIWYNKSVADGRFSPCAPRSFP